MSEETDRHDRETLAHIGRNPGCKRRSARVVKASVQRLIRDGLVEPPSSNGKLYLTPAGENKFWAQKGGER